jgi:hypothetical protein
MVGSLAMHSFSICTTTTLESVRRMHFRTPIARNLQSPNKIASNSVILLVHLSTLLLNYNPVAYRNLIPEGDVNMAAAPAPASLKLHHNRPTTVILVLLPQPRSWAPSILP